MAILMSRQCADVLLEPRHLGLQQIETEVAKVESMRVPRTQIELGSVLLLGLCAQIEPNTFTEFV